MCQKILASQGPGRGLSFLGRVQILRTAANGISRKGGKGPKSEHFSRKSGAKKWNRKSGVEKRDLNKKERMNKGIKCSQDRLSEKPAHQWKSHHLVQKWYLADAGETSICCMNCIVMYCIVLNDNICYRMAFCLFVCLCVCLFVRLFVCLFVCLWVCLFVFLFVCL